jgi:cytoskeletal protein CcmA (bactofilin family)
MATYVRQSSFSDGDTITAALFNNEFNQLVNAFNVATGHTHDGSTAGDGGPISNLFSNALVFGTNTNNDVVITFNATSNDGVLTWMEDEDYFQFSDDLLLTTTEKVQFRDTAIYINSSTDGQLDIVADTEVQIAATTIDMNGNADISGNLGVGGNLTVTGTTTFNGGTITMGDAATDNVVFGADVDSNIIPDDDDSYDLGSSTQEWRNLYIDGTANIDSLVADTADINGGTIDAANITVGSGKTLDVSAGTLTLADNQISGDKVEGGTINATTINTLTYGSITDGTITVTAFVDEDNMASNSATLIPTQQSVKAYVDAQDTAQDLDLVSDSGTIAIDLDGETLTVTGGEGIDTSASSNTLTITGEDATTSNKGIASFNSDDFNVSSGAVTLATTSTAAELNLLDGTTAGTIVASKGVAVDANKDITGFRNITLTGELDAGSLDVSGNVDVDGTLETDALSINGTAVTSTAAELNILDGKAFLDEDDMSSNSATGIASQQSIKAYVDAQQDTVDTLAEILALSNATGGTDIAVGTGDDITFADSSKAIFGAGSDLQIYHDGGTSVITDQGTGFLALRGDGNVTLQNAAGTENKLVASSDGAVTVYYDNAARLATTSGGISVTGEVAATSLDISGDIDVDGTTNLDVVDIDGAVDMAAALTVAGTATFTDTILVTRADNSTQLTIESTDADGQVGPRFDLHRNSASPSASDNLGQIRFLGDDSAGVTTSYAFINSFISNPADGSESGEIVIETRVGGANRQRFTANTTETIINEDGADLDFRVESNGNANMLFVDGGNNRVGVGMSANSGSILNANGHIRAENSAFLAGRENASLPAFSFHDDTDTGMFNVASNILAFSTAGTERFRIASDGAATFTSTIAATGSANSGSASHIPALLGSGNYGGGIATRDGAESGWYQQTSGADWHFYHNRTVASQTPESKKVLSFNSTGAATFNSTVTVGSNLLVEDSGNVVINETSVDADFRVESDSNTHAVFVDASTNRVGILNNNPAYAFHVDAEIASSGYYRVDSSSSYNGTALLTLKRNGNTTGDYLQMRDGSNNVFATFDEGGIIFNEVGGDTDFRVESDNNANMLFVDGGNDFVSIGTATNYASTFNVGGATALNRGTGGATTASGATLSIQGTGSFNSNYFGSSLATVAIRSNEPANNEWNPTLHITTIRQSLGTNQNSTGGIGFTTIDDSNSTGIDDAARITIYNENSSSTTSPVAIRFYNNAGGSKTQGAQSALDLFSTGAVFNNDSNDMDFRVESNDNTHMLFVDGGANHVGIGQVPSDAYLHIKGNFESDYALKFNNTQGNASAEWGFRSHGTNGETLAVYDVAANEQYMTFSNSGTEGVIFNEDSHDQDFRVESNGNTHMLFVDASVDRIGIGTSSPDHSLDLDYAYAGATVDCRVSNADNSNSASGSRILSMVGGSSSGDPRLVVGVTGIQEYSLGIDNSDGDTLKLNNGSSPSGGVNFMSVVGNNTTVFNDAGANLDFRVEGDTAQYALFVDASNDVTSVADANSINAAFADKARIGFNIDRPGIDDHGGHMFMTQLAAEDAWMDICQCHDANATGVLFFIHGVRTIDQNRSYGAMVRYAYQNAFNVMSSNSQNATVEYRVSNDMLQYRFTTQGPYVVNLTVMAAG